MPAFTLGKAEPERRGGQQDGREVDGVLQSTQDPAKGGQCFDRAGCLPRAGMCSAARDGCNPPPPHPEGSSFALHTSGALKYFPHAFAASKIVHIFLKEDIKQTNGSAMLVTASKGFSLAIMKSKG